MVLTNFECWAHGGSNDRSITFGENLVERRNNVVDLFNPALLRSCNTANNENVDNDSPKAVCHLSSNGYYGFAQICNLNLTPTNNEASVNASGGDVNITQTQTEFPNENFMDVEQHQLDCSPHNNVSGELLVSQVGVGNIVQGTSHLTNRNRSMDQQQQQILRNGCNKIRRKRIFDGQNIERRQEKRYRFDNDHQLYNGNRQTDDGAYEKSMDHEDIPYGITSICDDVQANNQQRQFFATANLAEPSYNCQSNSRNYKYSDISRCLSSHMI